MGGQASFLSGGRLAGWVANIHPAKNLAIRPKQEMEIAIPPLNRLAHAGGGAIFCSLRSLRTLGASSKGAKVTLFRGEETVIFVIPRGPAIPISSRCQS